MDMLERMALDNQIAEQWMQDFPQQFQGQRNIECLVRAFARQLEEVQEVFQQLNQQTDLETAGGKNLDMVGDIVGLTRKEAGILAGIGVTDPVISDKRYRQFLRYKQLQNTNECTYYDVMRSIELLWSTENITYLEDPAFPATIFIELPTVEADSGLNPAAGKSLAIKPAGVALIYTNGFILRIDHFGLEKFVLISLRLHYKLFGWQGHRSQEALVFRWALYEPNEMSFLPIRLCWKIYMQSKVTAERLRLHMDVMYWGADGLLDGSWLLDGSRLLDACRRYGVLVGTRFGSMEVHQESSAALHGLAVWWRQSNPLASSRAKITQRFSVAFFGIPQTLDGSWLLDGSVLLDAGLRYGLRPALKVALAVEMPAQRVDGTAETKTEDYWFLDGSVALDGSRCLDSVYRKESLE